METFLQYVKENYLLFTLISGILILALIGYIVDSKSGRDITIKPQKKRKNAKTEETNIDSI